MSHSSNISHRKLGHWFHHHRDCCDVGDDVDAGVISHVILSAAQAADRRVLMVSPQNAADLTRPVVLISATMTKGRVLIFSLHIR